MSGPGGAQVSLEQDYTGDDFTASLKSINPSGLEGELTGMFIGSYLQSVTPRLSLGLEGVWQKPGGGMGPEAAVSYAGRYKGDDWIASAQLLTQGGLQLSYWKKLMDKVETGVDVNLQFAGLSGAAMMGGSRKEGVATLGAKYEFSRSIFRAQVDSQGKLGCLLEKVVAPPVRITFAGELDHVKVRIDGRLNTQVQPLTSTCRTLPRSAWPYPLKPPARNSWSNRRASRPPFLRSRRDDWQLLLFSLYNKSNAGDHRTR